MKHVVLSVDSIRTDGGTQVRVQESPDAIQRYADALAAGKELPPIHVFLDGTDYWLADGHHRLAAYKKQGLDVIPCIVHEGDRTAALKFACQANQEHGLPLTNADKRNIATTFFTIPGNENKSNNAAAKELGVSVPFVKSVREAAGVKPSPSAHVGIGSKKNLNGLNIKPKDGENCGNNLNRLNDPAATFSANICHVALPTNNEHEFSAELIRHFDLSYLQSCMRYFNEVTSS